MWFEVWESVPFEIYREEAHHIMYGRWESVPFETWREGVRQTM